MTKKEISFLLVVLLAIITLVSMDIVTDSREGAPLWHLFAEGTVGFVAAIGIFILMRNMFFSQHEIQRQQDSINQLKKESEIWKSNSKKHIEGLSQAIDQQLSNWGLTHAEKEVALLLLKGLSIKEVSEVRHTSEKTTRAQATVIYQKSGLAGRSELSAFFLEDLLSPQKDS